MRFLDNIEFKNPEYFWLLLMLIPILVWYILKERKMYATVRMSTLSFLPNQNSYKVYLRHLPFALRLITIALVITVLARPQSSDNWQDKTIEGIDIAITLDISTSMLAQDFSPNRLEASKKVARDFIAKRPNDRMGLVVFAGESFTQCPLTTDHDVLANLFGPIKTGMIEDGTAIGQGLANAVNRLKESDAISKVVILLTDGENNAGNIPPATAAELAEAFGIRVYTIGVGTTGKAKSPVARYPNGKFKYDFVDVRIDEETLREIAHKTGGKYFRATNNESLQEIYTEIDKLERSKIDVLEFSTKTEEFLPIAILALVVFAIEFILRSTILKPLV